MSELSRIGVAIDSDLLEKFDQLIEARGYTNRSEAFRDLIRDELVQKSWERPDSSVVGTVTLFCGLGRISPTARMETSISPGAVSWK